MDNVIDAKVFRDAKDWNGFKKAILKSQISDFLTSSELELFFDVFKDTYELHKKDEPLDLTFPHNIPIEVVLSVRKQTADLYIKRLNEVLISSIFSTVEAIVRSR